MRKFPWYVYAAAAALLVVVMVVAVRWWRGSEGERFDAAKAEMQQKVAAAQAERDQLRGENNQLRQANEEGRRRVAELEAKEEAQNAIIKEAGGRIAAEQTKLQAAEETLKHDQDVINAPADRCLRCQRLSASLLAQRVIDHPLACRDECASR